MIMRATFLIATLVAGLGVAVLPARAVVEIDINKGVVEPLPIAITEFISADGKGAEIASVVEADLRRSGLFQDPLAAASPVL